MTFSDIWMENENGGKANYFIILNHCLSLAIIWYHWLF